MSGGLRGYLEALKLLKAKAERPMETDGLNLAGGYKPTSPQLPSGPVLALSDSSLGDFEVNMMEPLVGWKRWNLGSNGLLCSQYNLMWLPDKATKALCCCPSIYNSPSHGCGIYALDNFDPSSTGYGAVLGQVYGWGRYIRGDKGWRAQYAYPKAFYLTRDQTDLVEPLKKYHIPIFIDEPLRIYNPEEEGYDCGYRPTET